MISLLQKNHIISKAIEQPLDDMSVPENKLMLAIYISTPEAYYTDGKHEAFITERLFYQVQQIMEKKRKV